MSGFEVVGIVLAVLPLFVEASKASQSLRGAASSTLRDEKLSEFYETFWWETYELQQQMEKVAMALPNLSEERKREIVDSRDLDSWAQAADVAQALQDFFPSQDDYLAFQKVMAKVLELLARLVKDETVHISKCETDQRKMYQKLKKFQDDRNASRLSSGFRERFRFLRKEKDRETCLKNLKTWNKRIRVVVDSANTAADRRKAVAIAAPVSQALSLLRTLSQRLFNAVWKSWSCDCAEGSHEARFSLASCNGAASPRDLKGSLSQAGVDISFDFLVSRSQPQTPWKWSEGTVTIKPASNKNAQNRAELERICDAIRDASSSNHCLQLLVEDFEQTQRMWRLNWRDSRLQYVQTKPDVSLQIMMQRYPTPPLVERRRLALILAYSVLQLHESPWLCEQWSKENIRFFSTAGGVDLRHPYMSTSFNKFPSGTEPSSLDRFHRHPGILRLGILLIEIHRWKPLEDFWTPDDLVAGKPTVNTDLQVARRVLWSQALADCFPTYLGAIDACLQVAWAPSGSRVSLEDTETQAGIYRDVIEPMEREAELGNYCAGERAP